jgi:hypothetical protein
VDTSGYGGREVNKKVTVYTNDPRKPIISLRIKGSVETVARITPQNLKLYGTAGSSLVAKATIVPDKKYPFKILEAKAQNGKNIDYRLEEVREADQLAYVLTVENRREEKGRYFDIIYLKTDSKIMPKLRINVYGNLQEKSKT